MSHTMANMGPSEQDHKTRLGRKLTKKRKPERHSAVQYPERLKVGEDVQEDVTAPKGNIPQYMNQSVFSMIAAAGSKTDFHAKFDDESSSSGEEEEDKRKKGDSEEIVPKPRPEGDVPEQPGDSMKKKHSIRGSGNRSKNKLLKSLPKLNLRTIKEKNYMSQSMILPSAEAVTPIGSLRIPTPRDAPVMSRMLEAEAQLSSSISPKDHVLMTSNTAGDQKAEHSPPSLVTRLREIFGFEQPEEVISGWFRTVNPPRFILMRWQNIPVGCYKASSSRAICILQINISASTRISQRNL